MTKDPTNLGEILRRSGLLDQSQMDRALSRHRSTGERLGSCLVSLGYLTQAQIDAAVAMQSDIRSTSTKRKSGALIRLVDQAFASFDAKHAGDK